MKNVIALLFVLSAGLFCTAGIYRHDRDKALYIQLAHQKQFDCVVQLFYDGKARGSAVLIDGDCILTAAHNLYNSTSEPGKYYIEFNGRKYFATHAIKHPNYPSGIHDYDIAFIRLAKPVDDCRPSPLCHDFNELHADVTGAGFGGICRADRADVPEKTEKLAGENVIDSLCGCMVNGQHSVLMCDFDCPADAKNASACNRMGSNIPRDLEYMVNGGDSGGGLFRENNGHWELVGICSGGGMEFAQFQKTGYYGHILQWTRVSVYNDWIDSCRKSTGK